MHCFLSLSVLLHTYLLLLLQLLSLLLLITANDECEEAVAITTLPFSTQGNLESATADFGTPVDTLRNLTCGITTNGPGVWYRITQVKENQFLQAILTDAADNDTNTQDTRFNTALFVGSSCDDLTCMVFSEYQLEKQQTQPTSTWFALEDKTYFLHVAGVDDTQVGGYTLQVTALDNTDPPPNDQCTQPLPLTLSAPSINGNSTWARPHGLHNADCSLQPYTRGLFYSITGTGTTLELTWTTTAAAISNGRFEIAIMSEACRRCVQSSDFLLAEDVPFVTTFDTVEDLDYVILVSGQGFGDVGAFTLQIKPVTGSRGNNAPTVHFALILGSLLLLFAML